MILSDTHCHLLSFEIDPADMEPVQGALFDFGYQGLQEEALADGKIRIQVSFKARAPLTKVADAVGRQLPAHTNFSAQTVDLRSVQFQPPTFEPIEIAEGVWVVPPDDMPTHTRAGPGRKIIIRPSTGFGTGRHATTQLTGQAFWKLSPVPRSVLDIGTGSGILAILAKIKGVPRVHAVEIDSLSRENALENFILNRIGDIELYEALSNVKGRYEGILANILSSTILELKDSILERLSDGGTLILSGILDKEGEEIERGFSSLKLLSKSQQGEWLCFSYRS